MILDDVAGSGDIANVYNGFCEEMKDVYPVGTMFIPSNLTALEKLPDWQRIVASRCEDTPSPGIDAQIYQSLIAESMQGDDVYIMTQGGDGWGYKKAGQTDWSPFNDGRIDPRPKRLALSSD